MKKILYKALLGVSLFVAFTSCNLDEYNPTQVPADELLTKFENWADFQAVCYDAMGPNVLISGSYLYVSEAGTDMWLAPKNGTNSRQLLYYTELENTLGNTRDVWNRAYMSVQQCCDVIKRGRLLTNGDADNIKVLIAEARFLRAFYYSILVTQFGNVTLVDENTAFSTAPKRSSYSALYNAMVADLKAAANDLKITPYGGNKARPTKKSALGLLARVYAQGAGQGLSEGSKSYWIRAKEVADDLITNAASYGAYLYTDFEDVFAQGNNRVNREALFSAVSTNPLSQGAMTVNGSGHNINTYVGCQPYGTGAANDFFGFALNNNTPYSLYGRMNSSTMAPSKYLLDCFDARYDKRWENSFVTAFTTQSFSRAYAKGGSNAMWKSYDNLAVTITAQMCTDYQLDASLVGRKIYPYCDLTSLPSYTGGINQMPAKVWPKGTTSGADTSTLVSVKNIFVHPYPLAEDENRFGVYLSKDVLSDAEKAKRGYLCINIDDMFDASTGYYYELAPKGYTGTKSLMGMFPMLSKYMNNYYGAFVSNSQQRAGDIMVMRMAEIYLIAAEATLNSGGSAADAAGYLNTLRQRACRDAADFNTSTGMQLTTATIDDVFDEYARELCGEFNRWALLKRNNALSSRLQRYNKRAYDAFNTNPEKYSLRPIHTTFFGQITNPTEYGNNGYSTK